ncbi:MAG: hypothetical protein HY465_02820 [Deltaproteobacteria bacterium]|nr:hypothetical protein [Deltaproteobacteria bacterium]
MPKKKVHWKDLTLRESIATIAGEMQEIGVETVLTGKACAAIYAPRVKTSVLDLVTSKYPVTKIEKLMSSLGFTAMALHSFRSPMVPFEVVFFAWPPIVGDEIVGRYATLKTPHGSFKLLSPTDCVRHRLAAWYRWSEEEALDQALAVASRHEIDLPIIRRWSEWEWSLDMYQEFVGKLSA